MNYTKMFFLVLPNPIPLKHWAHHDGKETGREPPEQFEKLAKAA
jgi:hypothetical protein